MNASGTDNNCNPHPPEPDCNLDIFASTRLRDYADKNALLQNIGYLHGIRVDDNDGPQRLTRRVARFVGDTPPLAQEISDFFTETIATKTERETNYIHYGWSVAAASANNPWISSRIAANSQPNAEGTWLTRRTQVQRFRVRVSRKDLAPDPEFKSEIEAALQKPSIFQRFEAIYQVFHDWGDVVPLEVEMGASLVFTDLETNMSQLPATASWIDTHYLTTIRTARTTRQEGTNNWENDMLPRRYIPPLEWRQVRIKEVLDTTRLLPAKLQDQLSQLYAQRISYVPALVIGPSGSLCETHDDTHHSAKTISGVTIYTSDFIRTVKFVYTDGSRSSEHKGSETHGAQHEMMLTAGEHITDIFIWRHDWTCGLQFVTNFGRCSPHFGEFSGIPMVARSKGGVLVGIMSLIQQHEFGRLFRKIQGIWRHDVVDMVPKEEDVFSDYFGSHGGRPFNDRVVVRNSNMTISNIEVGCGSFIESLQITYLDTAGQGQREIQTECHGGPSDKKKKFTLEPGENITSVSGKHDDQRITQMIFVTDQGRSSDVLGTGESTGKSLSFSVSSPKDTGGKRMRLQYVCGKSDTLLKGIMFVWTPT